MIYHWFNKVRFQSGPCLKIIRVFPVTLWQRLMLRIAILALTLCRFQAEPSRVSRQKILCKLDSLHRRGH